MAIWTGKTGDTHPAYSIYESVEKIPGWLHKVTALRTIDMLQWQAANGVSGNLMEIGVFCGRYLSLLIQSALEQDEKVLGIDTFQFSPKERLAKELSGVFHGREKDAVTLWSKYSTRVTAGQIVEAIGRPRFVSVDGAHDYETVFRDLVLCDEVVSCDGLIAADDFLNPLAIGVNQAVNQFLSHPRSVVPVAYVANKLFLAHRSKADEYRTAIEKVAKDAPGDDGERFKKGLQQGRHHVVQPFYGHEVVLM